MSYLHPATLPSFKPPATAFPFDTDFDSCYTFASVFTTTLFISSTIDSSGSTFSTICSTCSSYIYSYICIFFMSSLVCMLSANKCAKSIWSVDPTSDELAVWLEVGTASCGPRNKVWISRRPRLVPLRRAMASSCSSLNCVVGKGIRCGARWKALI